MYSAPIQYSLWLNCLVAAYLCSARRNPVIFFQTGEKKIVVCMLLSEWGNLCGCISDIPLYFEQGRWSISTHWPMGTRECCCYSKQRII